MLRRIPRTVGKSLTKAVRDYQHAVDRWFHADDVVDEGLWSTAGVEGRHHAPRPQSSSPLVRGSICYSPPH